MDKIRVSETGEVDIKSIESLSYDKLKQWIKCRLLGKDTQIPDNFRRDNGSYYIIYLLYPKFNRYVREDINRIVLEFIKDMAHNPDSIWKEEAGDQLLLLAQSIRSEETIDFLLEMAELRLFFVGDASSSVEDLHYRVLQTLVALEKRINTAFWLEQFDLAPEHYAGVVFDGLMLVSPEQAVSFLFSIDSTEQIEEIIFSSFPYLLDEYGVAQIVPLVEEYLPKMKPDVRTAVQSFFADEGCTLVYQSSKTKIDYERVREIFANIHAVLKFLDENWKDIQNFADARDYAKARVIWEQIRLKLNDATGAIEDAEAALKFYCSQNVHTQSAKDAE